jgi:purine-binding chemotaxis protein CheW
MTITKEAIFKARAEALALAEVKEESKQGALELALFSLSKERYAIESIFIREAYPLKGLTVLPCVPAFVKGVIQVRRKIYSVIDLRILFDLRITPNENLGKVLIIEKDKMAFGIFVEEILGVTTLFANELQLPLPSMTGVHHEFVKGISKDYIVVLDGNKLLNSSTVVVEQML